MLLPNSEEYGLLYTDEFGDFVGLDEVQLLDPPLESRIPALSKMLNSTDPYISYQAVLVLTAWGKDIGLKQLKEMLITGEITTFTLSPNRITGEDNVYDELSYAVHLYGLSGGDQNKIFELYIKFLEIYPYNFFESKLKYSLLKSKFKELYPFVEKAVVETLAEGRIYQASQLLPVLTKLEPKKGAGRVQKFKSLPGIAFGVEANIKEALEYR